MFTIPSNLLVITNLVPIYSVYFCSYLYLFFVHTYYFCSVPIIVSFKCRGSEDVVTTLLKFKMEYATIVNGWKLLSVVPKLSILYVCRSLTTSLDEKIRHRKTKKYKIEKFLHQRLRYCGLSFPCRNSFREEKALRTIYQNTSFLWPLYSSIRTESSILVYFKQWKRLEIV